MAIKDSVLAWFVKEYIIPNAQVLDKPGFVVFNISGKNPLKVRPVTVPEDLFEKLEIKASNEIGDDGRKILYTVGKKFGYSFAIMGGFSTKKDTDEKKLIDYIKLVNKFIEGTYASLINGQTDYQKSKVTFELNNFVVCNKLGYGYFLPLGAGTGLVAKLMEDTSVEGIHLQRAGKTNTECTVVCAPARVLSSEYPGIKFFTADDMNGLELPREYKDFNSISEIKSSSHSFRKYLETGLFTYDHGIVTYEKFRYFIFEVTGLYLLSIGFEGNQTNEKLLFDAAFSSGKEVAESYKFDSKNIQSLIDILVAFGWGDVSINKVNNKVIMNIKKFPWTKFASKTKFTLFRGFFSGLLTGFAKRDIVLQSVKPNTQNGYLELTFSE